MIVDNPQQYYTAASGTVHTETYVNAGNLLYGFVPESRNTTATMTYDGVSGTLVGTAQNGAGQPRIWVYRWVYPPIGSHSLVATYGTTLTDRIMRAFAFIGADTGTPDGTVVTKTGTAINKSLDVTTTKAGSYIVDCLSDTGNVLAAASGQTMLGSNSANRVCSYRSAPTAGAYTNNWTGTSGANNAYAGLIFEVFAGDRHAQQYYRQQQAAL